MRRTPLRALAALRRKYWVWPGAMTLAALALGIALPWLDGRLGSDWLRDVGVVRATQVDGARAILTTLAAAALGVAGVAFSITIVAVSFASSNYGPRLIGNFMADRLNQVVLGVLVATFTYCITVLSAVHGRMELAGGTVESFVPQVSVLFALALTLASVAALIVYIHHIPESINIMNLAARIGAALREKVVALAQEADEGGPGGRPPPAGGEPLVLRAEGSGFLQWIDAGELARIARREGLALRVVAATGEFVVEGDPLLEVRAPAPLGDPLLRRLRRCHALGPDRTDADDVLFLSDQLVEVAVRAMSPGVNDPHTAILCLDWLRTGLDAFARLPPRPEAAGGPWLRWRRVTFEAMLDRSFDRMRQHLASDRTVALHALDALAALAAAACRPAMAAACERQMRRLAQAAGDLLDDRLARDEVARRLDALLRRLAAA